MKADNPVSTNENKKPTTGMEQRTEQKASGSNFAQHLLNKVITTMMIGPLDDHTIDVFVNIQPVGWNLFERGIFRPLQFYVVGGPSESAEGQFDSLRMNSY